MDQQKLRSLVFEKTGIKIDTSDPVFAVVAMNEALLEEAVQRHLLVLEQSSKAILQQLQALRAQAAGEPVPAAHDDIWENSIAGAASAATPASTPPASNMPEASVPPSAATAPSSVQAPFQAQLRLAAMTALMTVALMLPTLGMFAPKASAPATAPALTPQQETQLKQFDKLQKLLPSLDAKSRAQIEAELKKP